MNWATGACLVLRGAYALLYIGVEKNRFSYARSVVWAASVGVMMAVLIKAGNEMVRQTS